MKKIRPRNKADGRNKQNQANIFDYFQCVCHICMLTHNELFSQLVIEQAAVYQRYYENTGSSEVYSFDFYSAKGISQNRNCKDRKHQKRDRFNGNYSAKQNHNIPFSNTADRYDTVGSACQRTSMGFFDKRAALRSVPRLFAAGEQFDTRSVTV